MMTITGILIGVPAPSESRTTSGQTSSPSVKKPLIEGSKMRCPKCELLRDPLDPKQFRRLEVPKAYEADLNPVYKCMARSGGCGHVFSPGDPQIMAAYLAGDLVPRQKFNDSNGGKH